MDERRRPGPVQPFPTRDLLLRSRGLRSLEPHTHPPSTRPPTHGSCANCSPATPFISSQSLGNRPVSNAYFLSRRLPISQKIYIFNGQRNFEWNNVKLQSMQFTLGVDFEVLNVEYRVNFPRGQSIANPKISLQPYFIMRRCTYVYKQKKFARHLQHTLLNWRGSQSLFGRFSSHLVEGGFPKICSILHLAKEASCPTKSLIRAGEARVKRVSMSAITNSRWEAGGQWLYQSDFL